ncbi:MAG: alpha/beta hydrolase [Ruminiclostridium sp.]|nr:alpha/beta hydrolase [Ruminiclostridium sp.]
MKLCILFPGIGYHCEKPLLYYSSRLAKAKGYDVTALVFSDFPEGAKGNADKMRRAAAHALGQSEEQLADIGFSRFDDIVFIGKSIGTKAALAYREKHGLNARAILLTPLEMTFENDTRGCIAFHGTSDQWADTSAIERLCEENKVPLFEYKRANHSVESDDVFLNISYLRDIMEKTDHFLSEAD